jgi:inosine-uridine nucleoside N-ribohydrolase
MATPVVIDCDPGHDDAIALLLALASPELELLGVTTVAGNQSLEKTTANAIRVLELVGRGDVPVAAGAARPLVRELVVADWVHGESGLDGPALAPPRATPFDLHAVDFLASAVESTPAAVTLVATGPLTNVALFLARYPEHAAQLERVVSMGGAIAEGNVTPAAEFNVWADPEAAARVFASGLDVTMIGLDVTHRAQMLPAHAERLRAAGSPGAFVAELFEFFHRFHAETYGFPGAPIHDAVAVAHVVDPGLVTTALRHVVVECASELCRGRTVVDLWRRTGSAANVHVGIEIDAERFLSLLVERIARLG